MHLHSKQIERYVAGEHKASEKSAIELHLSTCQKCTTRVQRLMRVVERLKKPNDIVHPNENLIFDYVAGLLDEIEQEKISEHIEQCSSCRALIPRDDEVEKFKKHMHRLSQPNISNEGKRTSVFGLRRSSWPKLGFAFASVLFLILFFTGKEVPDESRTRNIDVENGIVLLEPDSTEENLDFIFKWRPFSGATRYELILWDNQFPQRDTVISTRATSIAAKGIPFLREGHSYSYQIRALVGTEVKNQPQMRILKIE